MRQISWTLAAALLTTSSVAAQSRTAADTFQPWHSVMFKSVLSAKVSPDGRQIAFVRSSPRRPMADDSGAAWAELYLLDAGGREVPFVTGKVNVSGVTWTNDEQLTFLARREGDARRAVYQISTRGGEARKIFEHSADIVSFDLSRDGRWLAYLARDERNETRKKAESQGFNQEIYEEDLLFTRLAVADLRSGDGPADRGVRKLDVEGSVQWARFSPDGQRLLAAVTTTPLVDNFYVAQRLRVLGLDGQLIARIDNPGKIGHADWSPDGRHIAMISAADRNDPMEGRLMVVAASGGDLRDLLPKLEGHVSRFDWRDAETLVYVTDSGTETEVGSVSIASRAIRTLLPAKKLVVTGIDVDEGGAVALVGETSKHSDELYTLTATGGEPTRRTTSNPWLAGLRFAEQEVMRFTARDRLQLEGVLIYPLGYQKGQRYPLILVVHGGPESHFRNGWLTATHRQARWRPPAVLRCSIRTTAAAPAAVSSSRRPARRQRRAPSSTI